MDSLELPHVLRLLTFSATLHTMHAVRALGRASVEEIIAHLEQEGDALSERQVRNALYKLSELGAVRRVPITPQGKRAEWQYDDAVCGAFMGRMAAIFGPPSR